MTISYFPFDAGAGSAIIEAQWAKMARAWFPTGVLAWGRSNVDLNKFEVYADNTGLQVKVKSGAAWIEGFYVDSSAEEIITLNTADATNPRIDRIILKLDLTANTITLTKLTGTPAASPVAPALTQNSTVWEISLARVSVVALDTSIASGDVTDERPLIGLVSTTAPGSVPTAPNNLHRIVGGDGDWASVAERRVARPQIFEFDGNGSIMQTFFGYNAAAIGAGTILGISPEVSHPGILRVAANGATTGGGTQGGTGQAQVLLNGLEEFECIFRCPTTTDLVGRIGFMDSFNNNAVTDGAWIDLAGSTLSGKTRNNSTETTTGTTFAISTSTWYRCRIEVNSAATRIDFYLYDSAGVQLWTNNITTNIPNTAGRETGVGAMAYKSTAGAANILDLDWAYFLSPKILTR